MKKILKAIVIIAIIGTTIGITNISHAFSLDADLSSNNKLVAGQEVKVTLTLNNIDMDDGIRSIKIGKVIVGGEFEAISSASFSSSTWTPTYSNGGLVLMTGTPVKTAGEAVTLTLKVKSGITAKSSAVTFENIVASSGVNTGDISAGTKTIEIKAEGASEGVNNGGTTSTPMQSTKKPVTTSKNNTTKNDKKNSTATTGKLPKAGHATNIAIVTLSIIAIAVTVIGLVNYIKYKKKISDDK